MEIVTKKAINRFNYYDIQYILDYLNDIMCDMESRED